jgi:hypothetical protein
MPELWNPRAARVQIHDAGSFTGGGWKLCWHTTEGESADGAIATFRLNGDAPHFTLEVRPFRRARLFQHVPLDRASSSLRHPSGTPETNHANVIQVEICGFAKDSPKWSGRKYWHIRRLARWIEANAGVRRAAYHPFIGQPGYHRLSGNGWVRAIGHVGHCHCPNNDHVDPGTIRIDKVLA